MGLLDLAGKAIGGAVNFTASVAKEAYDASVEDKIAQETSTSVDSVTNSIVQMRSNWTAAANDVKKRKAEELYQEGLKKATHQITEFIGTTGVRTKAFNLYYRFLTNNAELSELAKYVDGIYNAVLDKEESSYLKKAQESSEYKTIFNEVQKSWVNEIKNVITENLKGNDVLCHTDKQDKRIPFVGISMFLIDGFYLFLLLKKITNDFKYDDMMEIVSTYCKRNLYLLNALSENEYGDFNINIGDKLQDDGHTYAAMAKDAVIEARQHLSDNETGFFEGMKKYLIPSLIENTSVNLWHYAMQKPFDQKKFNDAVENRNFFTATAGNDFEVVLAELYVKNQLGGSELVLQNLDEILKEASVSNPGYARSLCSFLAWMECYDLEYEVLKRTVANKIQLSEEMQKRLSFLADGGKTAAIKIYHVDDPSAFCFDTHSLEWGSAEFEMLFRKLKASNTKLDYALVIKGWHKPFPIQYGKKFHIEALEREFENLLSDFSGEVLLEKKSAHALNVNNMNYDTSYVFHFTSERNRGVNVLFECEKFGRNLQLNILVTFLPDSDMSYDDMLQYALSAKDSVYVKSFLESILQAIDSSLTANSASIYD